MFERLKAIWFIIIWSKWFSLIQELADNNEELEDLLRKYGLR